MKACFSSVCTDDSYQFFIPLFVYTVKKAYPDAGVKVFVKGELKKTVKEALVLIPYDDWQVKDKCFGGYPDKPYITSCLRFLIRKKEYKGYDYVFVRDIDFLVFSHKVSHVAYFKKRMGRLPYSGVRGPYRYPRRYQVNRIGWKGNFTRIAAGTFVFKNPEWFDKTGRVLKRYRYRLKHNKSDSGDDNSPASYRESDEVMLFRIVKKSGLPFPRRKGKDIYGKSMSKIYRDLHLGDFSKSKRGYKRLVRRLATECLKEFVKMEGSDAVWRRIRIMMGNANPKIREILRRVRKHAQRRLNSSFLFEEEIVRKQ
jgi:hypothetical protein